MCLIFLAINSHPDYPLIVAANRDEFFHRPAKPLHDWGNGIVAGKDLSAGGTWIGVSKQKKFAALTNFRDPSRRIDNPVSRGQLVSEFLAEEHDAEAYTRDLELSRHQYDGYNIIAGELTNLWYFSNQGESGPTRLEAGIYGLSNHLLDTPWPKVEQGKQDFKAAIENTPTDDLFDSLAEVMGLREIADDKDLPNTGVGIDMERYLSPRFIHTPAGHYGTRCTTVMLADNQQRVSVEERTWNQQGELSEINRLTLP